MRYIPRLISGNLASVDNYACDNMISQTEKDGKKDELTALLHKKMQLKENQKQPSSHIGGIVVGPRKK